jgi:hypothetical protein
MKTFSTPHNPEALPPPAPGYRYLGKDERTLLSDEFWCAQSKKWCILDEVLNRASYDWTIRRAINVDDRFAPPPAEWSHEGWIVLTEEDMKPGTKRGDDQVWDYTFKQWNPPYNDGLFCPDSYYRRRISSQSMNTSSSKPVLKPGQSIVVDTHDNPALAKAVEQIALSAGWKWCHKSHILRFMAIHGPGHRWERELSHDGDTKWYDKNEKDSIRLDARTDMGILIDLLEKPAIVPPKVRGSDCKEHDASYTKGADVVVFGCAQIAISLLESAAGLMGYVVDKGRVMENAGLIRSGNRSVSAIILSSGVTLSREQVKDILDYVDKVNKA